MSEGRTDAGAASFRRLASLGVTWVSIHTWDPLQRGLDDPVFAHARPPLRLPGPRRPRAERARGRAAGDGEAAPRDARLRGHGRGAAHPARRRTRRARRALFARFESLEGDGRAPAAQPDRDAQRGRLAALVRELRGLRPALRPRRAGGGRRHVLRGPGDGLHGRSSARPTGARSCRGSGPSSAGRSPTRPTSTPGRGSGSGTRSTSSASPPTSRSPTGPTRRSREIEAGWDRALGPLEAASRRWGKPVLLTEAGFPSIPTAARAPWREERSPADVWLQARCYEATLRALARRPCDRGGLLLALGAHVAAALPRPLARHRRQAGELHDGALVRRGSGPGIEQGRRELRPPPPARGRAPGRAGGASRPGPRRAAACRPRLTISSFSRSRSRIGCGLLAVVAQARADGLGGVVGAGHEPAAAVVADLDDLRAQLDEVVVEPAARAEPAALHPRDRRLLRQLDRDHRVDVVVLEEELGLGGVAREAVEDEAVPASRGCRAAT